jgi:hypothetical protein
MEEMPETVHKYLQCVEMRKRMKASFDAQDKHLKEKLSGLQTDVRVWIKNQPRCEIHLQGLSEDDEKQLGSAGKLRLVTHESKRALSQQRLDHLLKHVFGRLVKAALKPEFQTDAKILDLYTLASDYVWKGRETHNVTQLKRVYSKSSGGPEPKRRRVCVEASSSSSL